jgi:hypothetical protein
MPPKTTTESLFAEGSTLRLRRDDGVAAVVVVTTARHGRDATGRRTHALTVRASSSEELERLAELLRADLVTVEGHAQSARMRVTTASPYDAASDGAEADKLVVGVALESLRPE